MPTVQKTGEGSLSFFLASPCFPSPFSFQTESRSIRREGSRMRLGRLSSP